MSYSLATRRARLVAIRDQIDAGGGGALWLFTDAPMIDSPDSAVTATPAAILQLDPVSFVLHATEASMVGTAVGNATTSGIVSWALFVDGYGTGVDLRTVGAPGSGAQIVIADESAPPTARIWSGGVLSLSVEISEP